MSRHAAGEQQIGEVDTANDQHRRNRRRQEGNALARPAKNLIAKTREVEGPIPVGLRKFRGQPLSQQDQFGARRLLCHCGFEPADR